MDQLEKNKLTRLPRSDSLMELVEKTCNDGGPIVASCALWNAWKATGASAVLLVAPLRYLVGAYGDAMCRANYVKPDASHHFEFHPVVGQLMDNVLPVLEDYDIKFSVTKFSATFYRVP